MNAKPSPARNPWMVTAALFVVALLVRLTPLNRYVTPDEPIWVLRSVRFADAVAARNWAAIPQTGHPGVTTMALGALGIRLTALVRLAATAAHLAWLRNVAWLAPENDAAFAHLAAFLPAGRALVALTTTAGIAAAYAIARARLDERAARWLALFLALDPFFGGLAGLLHTDALQATFVLLAVLLALPQRSAPANPKTNHGATEDTEKNQKKLRVLRGSAVKKAARYDDRPLIISPSWKSLLGTALCLALAGLTKTLGLLAAPGIALALLLLPREPLRLRVARVTALAAATTALYLALYPPFWVDPRTALASLLAAASYHEGIGLRDVFFAGRMTADPGPLFYPAVLLFRLTPPVLIGLALAVRDGIERKLRADAWWFLLPALVYLAAVTAATKKFDRYALSALVLLAGVAATAWKRRLVRWKWALLAVLLWPWALVAPLPLYYADPLLGGPWVARHVVPLGWGEGYSLAAAQAARRLPASATILTANVPGVAPYFHGTTWPWDTARAPCAAALITEGAAPPSGYAVAVTPRLARLPLATLYTRTPSLPTDLPLLVPGPLPGAPADAVAPSADAPTLRAWFAARFSPGAPFRWVHAPDCYPVTESQLVALLHAAECAPVQAVGALTAARCVLRAPLPEPPPFVARLAGTLDLVTAAWPETARAPDALSVRLRWQALAPQGARSIYLALRGADGDVVWAEGGNVLADDRAWPVPAWETETFIESTAYIPLPLSLPPGTYTLTLSLSDSAGRWIGLTRPDGAFGGTLRELGTVEIVPPAYPATELPGLTPLSAGFPGLRLLGATPLPDVVWAGDRLQFRLGWERIPGDPPDTLHWALTCAGKEAEAGRVALAQSDPATWPEGHRYVTRYAPRTDPLLPEGTCALSVHLASASPLVLGEVVIRRRVRRFDLPQPPQVPLAITVGEFAQFAGVDVSQMTLKPGETFDVTLYVQAGRAASRDYTVFVHLVGQDGRLWAQSDAWPERGAAPTTSWVAGQVLVDAHTLTLAPDAPAGRYTLFAGLYDAERGGRVPLYTKDGTRLPEDRAPLAAIVVAP